MIYNRSFKGILDLTDKLVHSGRRPNSGTQANYSILHDCRARVCNRTVFGVAGGW